MAPPADIDDLQTAKAQVRACFSAMEATAADNLADELAAHTSSDYHWYGVHPFGEQRGAAAVAEAFWRPLALAFRRLQRREDVFLAGHNQLDGRTWVLSMGHFAGLWDRPWLGLPPTGRLGLVRYAEFQCVEDGKLVDGAMFIDVLGVMAQAGVYPLPPETGHYFPYPGPRTHDGILRAAQDPADSRATLDLVERMIADLDGLNRSGEDRCPPQLLARTWHDDMLWYGPCGIGASYTIARYQLQHQYPFREGLTDKVFNGHVSRIAEGHYAGFFGWPNLSNRPVGGFLGLPGSDRQADMRVVDVYRREGDRLVENWVFIDLPHWLLQQGLDVFARARTLAPSGGS